MHEGPTLGEHKSDKRQGGGTGGPQAKSDRRATTLRRNDQVSLSHEH